jgi:UDP-2,4-diacetamido-2,4,6-trideoxy-beta-L-altropyranose hydrolase
LTGRVRLRAAVLADSGNLLRWRNDPDTRRWSRHESRTSEADHAEWLGQALANASRRLWIAEIDDEAVGTVRVDTTASGYELSWTVAPECRGRGVGTEMVRLACGMLTGRVYAYVKDGNDASSRIAMAAGLQFESTCDGIICFAAAREPAAAVTAQGGGNVPHR